MHSPTFPSNYLIYICVDKLQNIYFNMKDAEHVANAIFLFFIWDNQGFFHLLLFAETLLCKQGVWGLLRAPEVVTLLTVKYAFSHFSWYLFLKSLTYIYVTGCQAFLFFLFFPIFQPKFLFFLFFSLNSYFPYFFQILRLRLSLHMDM